MTEYWIYFSIAWLVALWLGDFVKKLVLSKWWDKEMFLFLCFCLYVPLLWGNFFLYWNIESFDINTFKAAGVIGITDFLIPLWLLTAMKYLDVSFTLISLRIFSSIALLIIGVFIIWDQLTIYNLLWFFIGLVSIYLLSWFSFHKKSTLHKKWLFWLVLATLSVIFWTTYFKYMVEDLSIPEYMPLKFSVSFFCIILYLIIREKFQKFSLQQFKKCFPYAAVSALIFVPYFLFIQPNIFLLWPLSLWYKMLSYSLIIPILFSILFLWDTINRKKVIAFMLTIISIALFI